MKTVFSRRKSSALILLIFLVVLMIILPFLLQVGEKQIYPREYSGIVEKYSELYGVPENVVYAIIHAESKFQADAVSQAGAVGLMQIMPSTFRDLQGRLGESLSDESLAEPETNIKYGTYYIGFLLNYYNDIELAVTAYNAGIGNVNKWLADPKYSSNGELTHIPFGETRAYTAKVIKMIESEDTTKSGIILSSNSKEKPPLTGWFFFCIKATKKIFFEGCNTDSNKTERPF